MPILQRSQIDFVQKPDNAIKIILELVKKYNTGWVYSEGLARYSAAEMVRQGIVGNGKNQTLGDFEMDRVQRIIGITSPIFTAQKTIKADLKPADIATDEFIDPKIGLSK